MGDGLGDGLGDGPGDELDGEATAERRTWMVTDQLRSRGIRDERLLAAMAAIPRERFVTRDMRRHAYDDAALPIEAGQSISQPYMVARMTELLAVREGDRILEVGTGSGYQAAVLASLGGIVVTFERHLELADMARGRLVAMGLGHRVTVVVGDGSLGDPERAPFDGIIVTAAAPRVPEALRAQLADGGRLVVPVGSRSRQELVVVQRDGARFVERRDQACVFVPLRGAAGWPG